MSFITEFKEFAMRGNVIDLAVVLTPALAAPAEDIVLLTEIRDALRSR